MQTKNSMSIVMLFSLIPSMQASAPIIYQPGTTMWTVMGYVHALLQDTNGLMVSMSDAVINVDEAGNTLGSLVQEISKNSNSKLDRVINQLDLVEHQSIEMLRAVKQNSADVNTLEQALNSDMDGLVSQLDSVQQQSMDMQQAVSQNTGVITSLSQAVNSNTDGLMSQLDVMQQQSMDMQEAVSQNSGMVTTLSQAMNSNNDGMVSQLDSVQEQSLETLEAVKHNAEVIAQIGANNHRINAKLDALSYNLLVSVAELNENDALIFSVVDNIDNAIAIGVRNAQKARESQENHTNLSRHTSVRFIKNSQLTKSGGIVISEPGIYILTEALTIDAPIGIIIQSNDVTLDLNGFTITSLFDQILPLVVEESDTVLIKNGTFVGGQGIFVNGSQGVTLDAITVTYPTQNGIQMSGVLSALLNNCVVRNGAQAGILVGNDSVNVAIRHTNVSECQGNGLDMQAMGLIMSDCNVQDNGDNGIAISNSAQAHVLRAVVDNNGNNGIAVDSSVNGIDIESCRVMGNNGIGCIDYGATLATWINNLASGNQEGDYQDIKAVPLAKATSFWHNVYGN